MFLSEKQTRSIFAVAGIKANTKNNIVIKKTLNGKVFGQIYVGGTTDECIVPTDKITLANIKKVAVSCPMGTVRSKFSINIDINVLKDFPLAVLNITFPEWYGIGVDNSYMKTIAINARPFVELPSTATSLDRKTKYGELMDHIEDMIKLSFKRESYNPFKVTKTFAYDTSGDKVTTAKIELEENVQAFNPDNLVFHSTLNMTNPHENYVDCTTAYKHTNNNKEYSPKEWGSVTRTDITTDGNYYEMYELEHAGLKKGMDQHGLAGWPYVQPSEMSSVIKGSSTKTFYCLDIHYVSDRDMYEHPRQEKTLTLIASEVATLTSILIGMGISGNTEGTMFTKGSSSPITEQTKLSGVSELTMGSSWISDLKTVASAAAGAKVN